jgi:prepilin-type processing-associated H-X9-DG protein
MLLFLAACLYSPSVLEQLFFGWIYFPIRVLPQVAVDWPTAILGTFCTLAFVAGLHVTIRGFMRQVTRESSKAASRFGMRSTVASALAVGLLFASGTAMVGAGHQIVWLLTGRAERAGAAEAHESPVEGVIASARRAARQSQQKNNLKQMGRAIHNFHDVTRALPAGGTIDDRGRLMHGWADFIGPYIGFTTGEIDFLIPWNEPPNDRLYRCGMPVFINPQVPELFDRDGFGLSHVSANVHVLPISRVPSIAGHSPGEALAAAQAADDRDLRNLPLRFSEIHDGLANTLLIGEAGGNFRPWGHPANVRDPARGVGQSRDGFGGPAGAGGAQFLMCDGSVGLFSNQTNPRVLRALAMPSAGESSPTEARE